MDTTPLMIRPAELIAGNLRHNSIRVDIVTAPGRAGAPSWLYPNNQVASPLFHDILN
jgi:hypothetical protein